eukprot:s4_g73.t1
MGWPLFDELSEACGLAEPIEFPDLPRAKKYAGNAIHVPTFGVLLFTSEPAAPKQPNAKPSRGQDLQPRAKASTSTKFSSRWQRCEEVSIADLRTLLFAFNEEECEHERIKDLEKEDLLLLFEYSTGSEWVSNLAARHRRRSKDKEECIDRPLGDILKIMAGRKPTTAPEATDVTPQLMVTPSGEQALYVGHKSKSSGAYYISNGATGHWVTAFMADAGSPAPAAVPPASRAAAPATPNSMTSRASHAESLATRPASPEPEEEEMADANDSDEDPLVQAPSTTATPTPGTATSARSPSFESGLTEQKQDNQDLSDLRKLVAEQAQLIKQLQLVTPSNAAAAPTTTTATATGSPQAVAANPSNDGPTDTNAEAKQSEKPIENRQDLDPEGRVQVVVPPIAPEAEAVVEDEGGSTAEDKAEEGKADNKDTATTTKTDDAGEKKTAEEPKTSQLHAPTATTPGSEAAGSESTTKALEAAAATPEQPATPTQQQKLGSTPSPPIPPATAVKSPQPAAPTSAAKTPPPPSKPDITSFMKAPSQGPPPKANAKRQPAPKRGLGSGSGRSQNNVFLDAF